MFHLQTTEVRGPHIIYLRDANLAPGVSNTQHEFPFRLQFSFLNNPVNMHIRNSHCQVNKHLFSRTIKHCNLQKILQLVKFRQINMAYNKRCSSQKKNRNRSRISGKIFYLVYELQKITDINKAHKNTNQICNITYLHLLFLFEKLSSQAQARVNMNQFTFRVVHCIKQRVSQTRRRTGKAAPLPKTSPLHTHEMGRSQLNTCTELIVLGVYDLFLHFNISLLEYRIHYVWLLASKTQNKAGSYSLHCTVPVQTADKRNVNKANVTWAWAQSVYRPKQLTYFMPHVYLLNIKLFSQICSICSIPVDPARNLEN